MVNIHETAARGRKLRALTRAIDTLAPGKALDMPTPTPTPTDSPRDTEFSHLPARPWRYLGQTRRVYQAIPGDPNCPLQPGGCCDHCGTGIYECHRFVAVKTGEEFIVGSTCVTKMHKAAKSNSLSAAVVAIRKARNEAASRRNDERRRALWLECRNLIWENLGTLASQPHPIAWRAEKGDTALDWAVWMVGACGLKGLKQFRGELEAQLGKAAS